MRGDIDRVAARVRELVGRDPAGPVPDMREAEAVRFGSRRRVAIGIGVAVLAVVAIGVWVRTDRPAAQEPAPPLATAPATTSAVMPSAASGTPSPAMPSLVVVDVAGKVRHPGVYRLPAGSRVIDALQVAGGARAGVSVNGLNLAAVLVDGEQIAVGVRGAVGAMGATTIGGTAAAPGAPIDLNAATLEQLETLPGVGPALGQQILDWRAQHGRFATIGQLDDVPGIGPARLSELRPLVTV